MRFLLWVITGGGVGWLANIIMHTNTQDGIVLNIIVGIVGALLVGLLLTPLSGIGTINQRNFSVPAPFIWLLGAIILLAILTLIRRGTVR